MLRTYRFKLYLTAAQQDRLHAWRGSCCALYNRALEQRKEVYAATKQGLSLRAQQKWLTQLRKTDADLQALPVEFARSALRRVDHAMKTYKRRRTAGKKAGLPRFRHLNRYVSFDSLDPAVYATTRGVRIPGVGWVRARGRLQAGEQRRLVLIYKAGNWYADVLVQVAGVQCAATNHGAVGVDLGLTKLATLSNGETYANPRWLKFDSRDRRKAHKRLSRRKKDSNNWKKALLKLQQVEARTADRRRSYLHKVTTELVRKHGFIAAEDLTITDLLQSRFSKSISDVGWGIFKWQLTYKAECAGTRLVFVDPKYTSQTCPECGAVKPKELKERVHDCPCGCRLDRDVAAARVILARAQAAGLAAA